MCVRVYVCLHVCEWTGVNWNGLEWEQGGRHGSERTGKSVASIGSGGLCVGGEMEELLLLNNESRTERSVWEGRGRAMSRNQRAD